ncbi:hypothetical protein B0H14DRAFT_3503338 [Mycena olivaceomarginata]|nr:hypothetical protein B0H14DRAFT_3503338 [Mycena olivaceomarginata]
MRRIQIHTAPTYALPIAGVIGVVLPACAPATRCLAVADIPPAVFEVAAFVAFFIPAAFGTVARAPIAPAAAASAAAAIASQAQLQYQPQPHPQQHQTQRDRSNASTTSYLDKGKFRSKVDTASNVAEIAEQELTLAFYHCRIAAHENQARILTYLIPLRILRGHLPSGELMHRFPILADIFAPFVVAIRTGDIAGFNRAPHRAEPAPHAREGARAVSARALLPWVSSAKLSMFHCALRISGIKDVELEGAECLVANMVYKGFMRGYISHEKQMVVLAATNTFPRLADRAAPFALM